MLSHTLYPKSNTTNTMYSVVLLNILLFFYADADIAAATQTCFIHLRRFVLFK